MQPLISLTVLYCCVNERRATRRNPAAQAPQTLRNPNSLGRACAAKRRKQMPQMAMSLIRFWEASERPMLCFIGHHPRHRRHIPKGHSECVAFPLRLNCSPLAPHSSLLVDCTAIKLPGIHSNFSRFHVTKARVAAISSSLEGKVRKRCPIPKSSLKP